MVQIRSLVVVVVFVVVCVIVFVVVVVVSVIGVVIITSLVKIGSVIAEIYLLLLVFLFCCCWWWCYFVLFCIVKPNLCWVELGLWQYTWHEEKKFVSNRYLGNFKCFACVKKKWKKIGPILTSSTTLMKCSTFFLTLS